MTTVNIKNLLSVNALVAYGVAAADTTKFAQGGWGTSNRQGKKFSVYVGYGEDHQCQESADLYDYEWQLHEHNLE